MKILTLNEIYCVSGGRSMGDYDDFELMQMGKLPADYGNSPNNSGNSERINEARDLTITAYGISGAAICGTITGKPLQGLRAGAATGFAALCKLGGEKLGKIAADNHDKVRHPEYDSIWDRLF